MQSLDRRFLNITLAVQAIANEPNDNPSMGSQYIVGSSGSGAFYGVTQNSIARYNGSCWEFYSPKSTELEVFNLSTPSDPFPPR